MMGNVKRVMLPGLVHCELPRRDFCCLALNRNGLLSSLDLRGRRHCRHVGGSDALGHACAQSGEPIKIGYSMSVTGGLAPDGRTLANSPTPLPQIARFPSTISFGPSNRCPLHIG